MAIIESPAYLSAQRPEQRSRGTDVRSATGALGALRGRWVELCSMGLGLDGPVGEDRVQRQIFSFCGSGFCFRIIVDPFHVQIALRR